MQRAAIFASGWPIALDTNGTVRLARGFTSSRKIVSSPSPLVCTANWVFIRPMTFSALASATTCTRKRAWVSADSEYGGSEHDESPECTPASSMCSITPPTSTLPSRSAITSMSTSTALSRKRSSSTGESCETFTASRM